MLNSFLDQLNDNIFCRYREIKKLLMCNELLFQQGDDSFVVNGDQKDGCTCNVYHNCDG